MSTPFTGRVRALCAGAATLAGTLVPTATLATAGAAAQTGPYVALGDSYTSAPLVPNPTGSPQLCLRSTHNYPQDVRAAISPILVHRRELQRRDDRRHDARANRSAPERAIAPQFNALGPGDSLVSVGIGGNDADLIGVAEECVKLDALWPFGDRCKAHYQSGGADTEVQKIDSVQPLVAAVIQGIHARAPQARVLVVGYPDGLPQNGTNCYPIVPFSDADVSWFNSLEIDLNAVLASAAARQRGDLRQHVQLEHRP